MNKIFKVIWSKSKQCYIVVSEIAKNKTGKKKIVVASILAALAMQSGMITEVMAADPPSARLADAAEAAGTNGVAIGSSARSKSNQSVAIGYFSNAQAPTASPENPATAVGAGANADGAGTVALGLSANATGANAVALGGGSNGGKNKTEATAVETTAVGFNAKASNSRATAIGSGAASSGSDAIALGTSTLADSEKAIAIGANSKGTAIGATALGRDTEASGASATALGALASAKGSTATAIGMQASATGSESVAIGKTASATSGRALAVGTNAKATGASSVAVGSGAGNSGTQGFAGSLNSTAGVVNTNRTINFATTADGDNAVALGVYANSKNSGVAVGQKALAATGGVAIGKGVLEDTGNNLAGGVVIGQDSATLGPYSLAMGFNAFASGSTSMAVGHTASAVGNYAVAMGRKVSATGTSTAIGHHATASNGGLAIGSQDNDASNDRTTASAAGSIAIGKNTNSSKADSVAIGTNAQSTLDGAVALGSGSTTATGATNQGSTTINGITYNFAGATGNPNMQVSVGSAGATRQIKNVAAGEVSAISTDAINGSQLYAVASAVKPLKYVSINSTATGTGSNVDNDGAQAPNSIAIGPSSTVTKQNSIAFGNNAQSLSDDSITIGRNAKAESGPAFTTTSRAIAIGANSKVATNVTQGIAIGSGSLTDEGAVVTGDQSIAIGGNVKVDGHAAIAIGGDDARKAAGQQVSYTNTNDNEVTGTLQTAILNLTGYNLSNYKGTAASHAGVAYGTSALAGNAGVAIGTASDSMTRMNDKGQVVNNKPVTNAVAIGTGARANFDNSVAIGGGSNTDHYATKQVNAVIDGVEVKWSGGENISPGDVVSFGAKGFERQLKNVAPGEVSQTSTDAVNGSQIYSLARKVTNIMNGGSGSVVNVNATGEPLSKVSTIENGTKVEKYYRTVDVKDDGTLVTGAIAQTPASLALVNVAQTDTNKQTQTPRILGNVANGVKDNDAVNVSQLNAAKVKYFAVNSSDLGNKNNDGATGSDAIAIGPSAISNDVGAVALGKDAKANGAFTVALGGGNWQFKGAQANGVGTTALGSNTKTQENTNYQTVVGFGANTTNANATAIGYNAAVSTEGGVALGANSSSSTGRTMGYNPNDGRTNTYGALTGNVIRSTTGAVAVGNGTDVTRQITGVAAGTNDTDAVNVAQLKSVNLAFVGDSGFGDVNLANNDTSKRFAVKGDSTYLTTRANGNLITVSANKKDISVTNGTARADTGLADAKNVAEAINKAVSQNTYTWNLTADNDTAGSRSTINKADTVKFSGDQNITVARNGNTITSSLNKTITVDTVKANKSVTTGSGSNQITLDGTTGAVTGKNFSGQSFAAGDNVLSNTTLQIGPSTGGNNVSITRDGLTAKAGTKTAKFGANGIDAGGQQITNVSSGGNVGTNAANITDVKNAVSDVTLKLDTNSKTGNVKLGDGSLKITGANGIRTDLNGTGNSNLVIGLDQNTVNATTKGIALTGDAGSTGLKYLKDGDAVFKVYGDGNLVTTAGSTTGVKVSVDSTKVKDLAVEAVTVSKATNISDNPITVTPTAGINSKDYAIGIDTTKLAAKTNLAYTANGATAKTVSLAKGLNFVNGTNTVATVDSEGKVSFDLNQATKDSINKSATAVGRTITLNADSGTGSSQSLSNGNVSFAVSGATGDYISTTMDGSAVKVSTKRATIDSDANTGKASVTGADGLATAKNVASAINSAVNGLSQNLNISDGTKDSSVALKSQKLTVTGTGAATATVNNQTITVDVAEGTLTPNTTDGSVTGTTGVAKATEVAAAINNTKTVLGTKIDKNAVDIATNKGNIATNTADIATNKGKIATNTANIATNTANIAHTIALADDKGASTTAKSLKDGNVSFNIKGDNKFISTAASGNDVTLTVNEQAIKDAAKNASSFKVKANAHAEEEVKGGDTIAFNNGDNIEISQTGKTFTIGTAKNITVDSVTAGNTVINTSGLTNGTTAITGTGVTTDKVTVGGISIDKTDGINAGGKVISNVASGGTTDSNAANIGDVKQAVANLSQNLNITDGTNNGTIDLKNQKLNVTGANGVTATVNNQTVTVGLDANTVNATTKGIGLTADTGSTGNKYLKDGDVSFAVTGDGNLVSTSATTAGVKVAVDAAKVKDLAVSAVTVSKDAQADNPITVTPTAGTNSKDYAIGIDTTKLAAKTDLTYRANSAADANAKKVSLSKGLDFVDGGSTVATVDNDGKVSFDLNTATKTQINTNTADIATNKGNIATNTVDIATNKGNITKNTAAIATNAAAIARNITLGADTGTASSQSLSKADVAFNVKGATGDFVSTNMNGNTVEISTTRATINSNATTGEASVTGADGLATAKNVSDAINKAAEAAKAGAAWNITTNSSTTDKTAVKGGDTVDLVNGDNIEITQDGTDKKKITVATKKDITVDSVTANNKVTVGSGANAITLNGADGSVTGKAFTGTTFTGTSFTAGNTVINTNGLTNGTTAITGTGVTTDTLTVGGISIDKTDGINAGGKVISNVASGGTTATNAANIGDIQTAVGNQNLKFAGNTNTAAGVVNIKDDTFNIVGDGKYVTTDANGKDLTVKVSEAEVKKSAVAAVTVSTDTTDANNPLTVTPTTSADGTTKDYKITIDGTKIANKTNLSYKANDGTAKQVSLADGLNFKNGTLTTASIDDAGVVKYDVNTATITAGTDGTITGPTTDGVATGQNVADAINAAKKVSKTEITANTGEAANATTGNVTLTSTTAADGHTIYDVKLNDKVTLGSGANAVTIDGTAGKATIGSSVVDGVNKTFTTGGANAVVMNGADGTVKTGTVTVTGGTTNDITGLSNTSLTGADFATKGRAATEEQLKAATSATTLKITGDVATNIGSVNLKDDTFGIKGDGKYISTDVNGKNVNLTVSEAEVKKSAVAAVTVSTDTTDANNPLTVTPTTSADGTTKDYKVTIDGTKIANKTNLSYKANDGTAKQVSLADGLNFKNGTLTTASIDDAGIVKYDVNTAAITAGTDGTVTGPTTDGVATAQNVADAINAAKKASKTEITANTGEAANATTGNVTLTSTTAADGHTIYDVKLNDKVTLGTGANAVTIDGTAGKATIGSSVVDGVNNTITTGGTNSIKVDGATGTVTGLTNKDWTPGVTKAVTGRAATEDQLQKVADAASSQTWNITADKAGTTGAQTGTKKNATVGKDETVELVAGDNLTINQDERKFTYSLNKDLAGLTSVSVGNGTTETIKLDGATGKVAAKNAVIGGVTIDGDNKHVTGLSNTTWNGTATTGRAATEDQLKAVAETAKTTTDAVNLKFVGDTNTSPGVVNLKDDTLGVVGDGKYVSTDANGKNLTVKVSEAEVKKSAVAAVIVSTDTTDANNPLTVTPTTSADGTTKDYKVTIDGTKIANKTNLSYKANDGTAKQVSLADGLNFKNGTLTTASIDDAGVVKYDVNTAAITAGTDGTVTGPTTDGVATAQNVADAINAAKKAAKTEITANTSEAANATTGNVTLTSTTAADGHTIYDVKLNDKVTLGSGANAVTIDGTAGKAIIGSSVVDGVNNTFTTGGTSPVTLDGATGTITGKTANIGGITVNGTANTIGGLSNTTWNGTATNGRAATEDQLKAVADAAGSQTWKITADKDVATSGAQTGTKKDAKVGKDDKVQLIAGENLTVNQNERDFTYSLNKDLVKMNSATFLGTGTNTTVITGDSITQTTGTQTNTSTAAGNTVVDGTKSTEMTAAGQVIKDGAKSNKTTVDSNVIDDGNGNANTSNATSNTITDGTNTSTVTAGKAQIGTVGIDGVASKITTGGANAVVINGADGTVKTGTVTLTGGTTNDITGLSNTTVTSADFATKGRAATEEQLKAVGEQTWQITADKDAATSGNQTGTKKDAKVGKDDKVQLIAGENLTVNQNERDFTYSLNKDLVKMNSATFEATGGKTTVITGNSIAQTDGAKTNTSTAAGNTVADGGKSTVTTADGTTVTNGADSTATTAAGTTVTNANGNTKYVADGVRINTTGKNPVSLTDAGLDNGNNVIKNVASGHVNNDDTDNTNAANIADVKKATTTVTANNGEAANATTGNVTLTSTTAADGHTIYDVKLNDKVTLGTGSNAVTIDGTAGKATIGSSVVDGVNNTITTGGANAVALDGVAGTVKTGTVTVTGGTINDITGLSNTTVTSADFATKGRAATEEQLKQVGEQTWQITADKDATTSGNQTGTKKDAKVGKDDKVQLIAGENLTVNQNERDFTYSLNKDLVKMNSATFLGTGTNTTVITGDSITQTAGTQTNTSTAAGNTVADGTKSTETTAVGQVIKNGAKTNTSTVDENTLVDGTKSNKTTVDSNVIDDGNGNVNTSNATSNTITDGTNTTEATASTVTVKDNAGNSTVITKDTLTTGTGANKVTVDGTAGKVTAGSAVVDGVNNTITTGGANAVTMDGAAGTVKTGTVTVTGGTTNDITGLSNTTVTSADFATKGRAATEEQLKQVGEQTWQITADKDATTSGNQTGTKKDAKVGKDDKVQLIAGENLTVNQNERDFTYSLNKDLVKMNSATFLGTGTNTTVITGDSITQTAGTQTNTSTAAGNTVADGTKSTETTAAGQVIKDGAKTNTSTVDENTLVDGAKSNKTTVDSNVIDDGNGNVNTSNATSNTITDGTNTSAITAGKATIGSSVVDGVNNTITTGGANAVALDGAAGTVKTGTVTVTGGTTNDITGLSNTTVTSADFATKGRAATEEQLKQVGEQTWQITADKDAATSGNQTGTKKDAKVGKDDKVQLIAGENLTVNQNERDFTYSLNKDLVKMNSATFEATGGKTTVITGDSITQTDGTKTNTSTAAGNTVADGTKSTETTAAGQVIKDGAKTNKSTVDSNVIDDGNGNVNTSNATSNTIANGTDFTATTAAGTIVTNANGNTKYAADGVRINTTGKNPVSLTDAGLDNGNNVIKNVASGHVNNDDTDNTNAANIADVKKATTTVTANNGEAANATTGNVTLTSTTAADGHTIYDVKLNDKVTLGTGSNAVTIDGTAGKATIGSSVVDGVNNTITTGGANAVALDGVAGTVKTGTVTVTGGTINDITGLSNTTVTSADFATKGRAATEEQLKAVGEQTWQITADKDAATSGNQTGTKKDAKVGKDDKVQLIAGENLTVNQNERDFTYSLNKDLVKMNSATFLGTGTNTTVITGDSITQTAGTQTNTSTAAGNTVADGTKSTETTAVGQVIKNGAKTNTSTVDENTLVDGTKSNKTTVDSNVIDDGNGNVNTSNATSNTITDGTNTTEATASTVTVKDNAGNSTVITKDTLTTGTGANKVTVDGTAGKVTAGSAVVDGVNNTITTGGANAVTMDGAAGTVKTGTVTVTGGTTNDITGLSNTTVTSADFATKGRAATEEQLKQVGEQTWQITADKDATTSGNQTGTKKDAKVGKDDKVQLIAGENLTVNQNERDFTYSLNKDLVKMNSATFLGTGTNTTVITGDSITQTAGTQTNTSTAAGNTVADGTKSTETTAAGQVIKDGAKTNTSTVDENTLVDGAKSNKTTVDSNVIDDGNGNVNTSNATSNTITDGTNTSAITAGKATIGSSVVDGVNNTITTGGANAVALDGAAGTVKTGTVTVTGGTTNDITGLSNTTVTSADFATKGRAATEEQLKQVGEQTWQITADKDAATSGNQTGTKKDAKVGKDDKVQLIAGENLTVNQNERDFTYSLNKDLVKMNSATFEATGGKTTVITGDSITQTDGTKTNTSTAAGNTVADGTKSTETTAAGQVIKDGAKTNKSTVDSNVIDDGNGNVNTSNATSNTIANGTDFTATTAAGTIVTNANGNTKYAADGVRINTTGKNPVSLTDAGLDNGNNVIKNVASGHVNNDDTDNTNAANIADVKKATTTVTANNGEAANATTGNVTLTSTTAADGHTIYDVKLNDKVTLGTGSNAVTIDGTAGKATIGSSVVDGVNNTITTGGANAVALDGVAGTVKTGTVTVTGGTINDITGLSNTTVTSADFATKGRAATEEQLKAVGEQTWQITADKDATTSGNQTGTKKDAKVGKDDKVQLIAGENLTVNQNERDFTYSLNKDLVKMNSATFEATGGKTTVITGDSIAQTDGTKTNKSTAAGNTVADGGKSTATTADGTTVTNGADSTVTTAAGTTVTNANGNTNYAADGVRINTTGKNPVSLTDAGLDNGNNVIKNVASGHVNNDDTDNTNAANIADVKKATTTVTANNGEAANATTGNVTLTSTTAADGHTIYDVKLNDKVTLGTGNNAVTIDGTAGKATVGTAVVDGVNNTITTGGANAVALDGVAGTVKTGTVTVTGGATNDITGLSNTTVTSADFATKGRAATEEQLKQVGEQTWQITADKDATTSGNQTGTKKDAKVGKDDKVQLIAGENLTVNQNERDFTYSLNKDLVKMNSATFEATGGKTTVITGDSIAQTDGTKTNRSTAAGNTVADGTKSTETTAAGQVIKDGAKTNTSTVDENTLVDGAKSNKTTVDSNVIDDGNGNVNTSNATSNTITDGTNTTEATASTVTVKDNAGNSTVITKDTITTGTGANKVTVDGTAGKVTAGSAVIDGVNNTITTGGANTVKLDGAAGTVTGLTNTAWTPGVTKAVSGRAATEDQLQQVSDAVGAGWNINSGTVAGSTGEANGSAKTKISSGEEVQLQAGNNLIIDQNGKTLAYSLNKNLKDMESAIFNATGGKTTVIKGDSIVQTDGGKTNTSNAAGNTVVDGTKSTATTAAGSTITDGAKTNTNTADKNVIDDGAGNTNTSNATSNTIADPNGNTNTATATSNTLADNAGNSNVSNATSNNLTDNAGNSNVSNATSNTLKNAAGDETKVDAKGATVKDAAGNTTNVASTGATVTNAAGDTTKVEATGTTVADAAGNKATFTKDGVTITKPGKDTVSLTGNGLDNGNNKIVNVADGTNDTDAVNVRQLDAKTKAATTELTANGGESANNTTGNIVLTKTTAPDGHIIYDNKLNDKITLGAADPTKAITVDGTNGTIKAGKDGNAVAINGTDGTIKAGDGTNAVAIDGVNGSVKVADKIALNGKDGKAAIGTVGIDGKDGIITTGGNNPVAVNGKDGVVTGLTNKTWDPNNITSGRAATEDQVQSAVANAGWDATVGTEGSGVNSTPSATPEKIRPNETLTFKAGNNMMVSHAGKTISYAVNPELTDMKSATFKDAAGNTTVTNGNGITITPGSANPNNPNAGPVSLTKDGLNNGNNQIKGVAPGSDDTDAVNIGQLKASNAKMGDAIGQVAGEVQRVGAHAAAMAALKPIQYDPLEPTQIMAGVGNYRGETAAALGLAHYTNEDTMFNVGVSVGGNHNMVNAGVTHKFGSSPEKKNIPDRYKAGPISSVYVMQDEVSSLKKENAEQKYVIADQAARLNTLEAENERQRQELAETKQGLDDLRAAVDKLLASKG